MAEVIDGAALGDSQHALGCCRGVDALMWQSPLLAAVVGREGCEERGGLAASPFGTTEAFGPVCFARALVSTIDETGPDMFLTQVT